MKEFIFSAYFTFKYLKSNYKHKIFIRNEFAMSTFRTNTTQNMQSSHQLIPSPTYRSGLSYTTKQSQGLEASQSTPRSPPTHDKLQSTNAIKDWYNQRKSQQLVLNSQRSGGSTQRTLSGRRETQPSEIPSHIVKPQSTRSMRRDSSRGVAEYPTTNQTTLKTASISEHYTPQHIQYEEYDKRRNTVQPQHTQNSVNIVTNNPYSMGTSVSDLSAYARELSKQRLHCQSQMDDANQRIQQNASIMENTADNGHLYTLQPNGSQSRSTLHDNSSQRYFYQQPQPFICDESNQSYIYVDHKYPETQVMSPQGFPTQGQPLLKDSSAQHLIQQDAERLNSQYLSHQQRRGLYQQESQNPTFRNSLSNLTQLAPDPDEYQPSPHTNNQSHSYMIRQNSDEGSNYGSLINFQPLLSNKSPLGDFNSNYLQIPSQVHFVDESNRTSGRDQAPVAHRAYSHEAAYYDGKMVNPIIRERLDGLVSTANQYRTKACGMMKQMDREIHPQIKSKLNKAPGSSVTQNEITDQRNQRRRAHRKPPVPRAAKKQQSNDGNSKLGISVDQAAFQTHTFDNKRPHSLTPQEASQPLRYMRSTDNKNDRKEHAYSTVKTPQEVDFIPPNEVNIVVRDYSLPRSRSRSNSNDPTPRRLAPSPYPKEPTASGSLSEFYKDAEFVEFLKNIQLFVQQEDSPQKSFVSDRNGYSCRSYLYSNLQNLRERFKVFKTQQRYPRSQSQKSQRSRSYERAVQIQKATSMQRMQSHKQSSFRQGLKPHSHGLISEQTPKARLAQKIMNNNTSRQSPPRASNDSMTRPTKMVNEQAKSNLPEKQKNQIDFINSLYDQLYQDSKTVDNNTLEPQTEMDSQSQFTSNHNQAAYFNSGRNSGINSNRSNGPGQSRYQLRARQVSSRKTGLSSRSQYSSARTSRRGNPPNVQTKLSRQQQKHKKLIEESKAFLEQEQDKYAMQQREINEMSQDENSQMNHQFQSQQAQIYDQSQEIQLTQHYPGTITSGFQTEYHMNSDIGNNTQNFSVNERNQPTVLEEKRVSYLDTEQDRYLSLVQEQEKMSNQKHNDNRDMNNVSSAKRRVPDQNHQAYLFEQQQNQNQNENQDPNQANYMKEQVNILNTAATELRQACLVLNRAMLQNNGQEQEQSHNVPQRNNDRYFYENQGMNSQFQEGEATSAFGSQDYNGATAFPTVDQSDVPYTNQNTTCPTVNYRSLDLSMVSNQHVKNLVNKMQKGGEYSMGDRDCQQNTLNLSNSQKAERFFQGLNSYVASNGDDGASTNQFGNSQVLGQTALVHTHEDANYDQAIQTIQSAIREEGSQENGDTRISTSSEQKQQESPGTNSAYSDQQPQRDTMRERKDISRFYTNQVYSSYDARDPADEEKVTGDFSNNQSQIEQKGSYHMQSSYVDTYDCQLPSNDLYIQTEQNSEMSSPLNTHNNSQQQYYAHHNISNKHMVSDYQADHAQLRHSSFPNVPVHSREASANLSYKKIGDADHFIQQPFYNNGPMIHVRDNFGPDVPDAEAFSFRRRNSSINMQQTNVQYQDDCQYEDQY